MGISLRRLGAMAVVSLALVAACSSEPTSAPTSPLAAPASAPSADLLGGVVDGLTSTVNKLLTAVVGVQRNTGLASSITVTKTIGSGGGSLSIPQAGVTVTVPSGALASNTVITMTARAGKLIAYDFAPHGVTFAKPLVFTQSLSGTNASLLSAPFIQLGYYADPSLLSTVGALVSELLGGNVNFLNWTFTANIKHFSGYIVACGRGGSVSGAE